MIILHNPWPPQHQRRDPNAMDTSANRGRARIVEVGDLNCPELNHDNNTPARPPFAPREGYLRRQREQVNMRGVQCFLMVKNTDTSLVTVSRNKNCEPLQSRPKQELLKWCQWHPQPKTVQTNG